MRRTGRRGGQLGAHQRFHFRRALIETVRSFRQVRRVKVVVALRLDLLQRVIAATRDSGFQSEKYEPLYLRLRWTSTQLIDLVSKRLSRLVRQRYTSREVALQEFFPSAIRGVQFSQFLTERTSLRPRDAILFLNECLGRAVDRQQLTAQMVLDAEGTYSEKRIDSLEEEWSGVYPCVSDYIKILSRRPSSFLVSELTNVDCASNSNLLERVWRTGCLTSKPQDSKRLTNANAHS
ncbi:MAG: P-loop ATPase, Sll1717 family [Burkholderiales bacterium]